MICTQLEFELLLLLLEEELFSGETSSSSQLLCSGELTTNLENSGENGFLWQPGTENIMREGLKGAGCFGSSESSSSSWRWTIGEENRGQPQFLPISKEWSLLLALLFLTSFTSSRDRIIGIFEEVGCSLLVFLSRWNWTLNSFELFSLLFCEMQIGRFWTG